MTSVDTILLRPSIAWESRWGVPLFFRLLLKSIGLPLLLLACHSFAQDGKALFMSNCAQCHNPIKVITGPALKGVTSRVTDRKLLHDWIHNNQKVLASGNAYFNNLYDQYGKTPMNVFPGLSDADIDAILKYVESYTEPMAATNTSTFPTTKPEDHTILYGIVTFILGIFFLALYIINSNLKKLAAEKRGIALPPHIPFYRNKFYISVLLLILFFFLGYWLVQLGIGVGRSKDYQPQQPIFFSHKVHAGLNQINCLYCHGNAWESKHATVPSPNVCLNCHATITEYKGERLYREDGTRVDPNEEIKKLYGYAGFDPVKGKITKEGRPIEWIKIHNLPDFVFFSHAQHVRAGNIACQTCHGPIQEMNEVRQFADLSMGWCINCHRTTRVNFPDSVHKIKGNQFYTSYPKFLHELQTGRQDSITVENIGGTECYKCHY